MSSLVGSHSHLNRHRGDGRPSSPATPPYMRVRIRRFRELSPCGPRGSRRRSPQGLRRSAGFPFGFTVFLTCKAQPKLIGWRSATREFAVLLLALTVWAFLTSVSTTPAADFCCRISVNYSTLSHESETCNRSPAISPTAFDTRPPDLPPASLMDTDFVVSCQLVRRRRPQIRFLSISPYLCSPLPSNPTSR